MNKAMLNILVCPVSGAPLIYKKETNELICKASKLVYPIKNGIPVLIEAKAKPLNPKE